MFFTFTVLRFTDFIKNQKQLVSASKETRLSLFEHCVASIDFRLQLLPFGDTLKSEHIVSVLTGWSRMDYCQFTFTP